MRGLRLAFGLAQRHLVKGGGKTGRGPQAWIALSDLYNGPVQIQSAKQRQLKRWLLPLAPISVPKTFRARFKNWTMP